MIYLVQAVDFGGAIYRQKAFLSLAHAHQHALNEIKEGLRVNIIEIELGDKDDLISAGILNDFGSLSVGSPTTGRN